MLGIAAVEVPQQCQERIFRLEIKQTPVKPTKLSLLCERYVVAQLLESLPYTRSGPDCWRDRHWWRAKSHLHSQLSEDALRSLNASLLETAATAANIYPGKLANKCSRKAFPLWWIFFKAASNDQQELLPLWPYRYPSASLWHEHPFPYCQRATFTDDLAGFLVMAEEAKGVQLESITLRLIAANTVAAPTNVYQLSCALKSQTNLKNLRVLVHIGKKDHVTSATIATMLQNMAASVLTPVLQSLTIGDHDNLVRHGEAPHLGTFILPCVQAHSTTLTSLELPRYGSSLCNIHAILFEEALNACTQLQKLSLSGECMSHFSTLLCLPSVRDLSLIWDGYGHHHLHNDGYTLDLANILHVCPDITSLVLEGVRINGQDGLALLEALKHCLTKMTCYYMGVGLLDLLKCCPIAKKIKIMSRDEDLIANAQEEPISLQFLQKFELSHNFHQIELKCLLKGCPDLRKMSLTGKEIFGYNQAELIDLLQGGGVLKRLETFHLLVLERYNKMTAPLLLEVMRLPAIRIVDNALWGRFLNNNDKEQVLALAREKGMDVINAYLCLEKQAWFGEDGTELIEYYD